MSPRTLSRLRTASRCARRAGSVLRRPRRIRAGAGFAGTGGGRVPRALAQGGREKGKWVRPRGSGVPAAIRILVHRKERKGRKREIFLSFFFAFFALMRVGRARDADPP